MKITVITISVSATTIAIFDVTPITQALMATVISEAYALRLSRLTHFDRFLSLGF